MRQYVLFISVLLCSIISSAENLIPGDSDFETGPSSLITASYAGTARWTMDNSTKANGEASIKISFSQNDWAHSRMIPLEAGEYTLSFYAKTNKENASMLAGIWRPWTDSFSKTFTLTKNWEKYTVTGKIKNGYCWICFGSNQASTDIWLDSVQLEKGGKATAYKPSKALYSGIYIPDKNDRVFFTEEKMPVKLTVVDSTKSITETVVSFTINDTFGNTVKKEVRTVKFDKSGRWTESVDFMPRRNGFYYMEISSASDMEKSDPFFLTAAVVTPPAPATEGSIPFLGLDGNGRARPGISRIGASWLEVALRWNAIEKTKGTYDWSSADAIPKLKKAGYRIKVIVFGVPEWAWNKHDAEEAKKSGFKAKGHVSLLPSDEGLAAFKTFLSAAAEKYKDSIDSWEIGAEDDLAWGRNSFYTKKYSAHIDNGFATGPFSERVAQIYNTGIDAIRSVTPNAKIGIVRPSGVDCTSRDYAFTKSILKHVNRKFDYLPLDPYCSPRYLGTGNSPSDQPEIFLQDDITRALKTTKELAQGQPVYVSELGYAVNAGEPMNNKYHLDLAARMLKSIIIARANPEVKMFNWFVIQGGAEGGKARYNMWWEDNPAAAVPVFSAAAHLIKETQETAELPLGENIRGYVFKKENEASAALWATNETGKVKINALPELLATDFCGGKISGKNIYDMNEYPLLFSLKGGNAFKNLCDLLSKAKYNFPALKMLFLTPFRDKGELLIKNNTTEEQKITLTASASGKEIKKIETVVPAGRNAETKVEIPLPAGKDKFNLELLLTIAGNPEEQKNDRELSFIPLKHIDKPVTVDGKLDEWNKNNLSKVFEGRAEINPPDPHIPYFGNDDFSAEIYCGWDENNLYIAASVKDDIQANANSDYMIWNGDCFQVALDSMADAVINKKTAYDANDFEFGASLNSKMKSEFYVWCANDKKPIYAQKKSAVVRDEKNKITFYEMSIPWKAMNIEAQPNKIIGLNYALIDDDDGSGTSYWYQLTQGIAGNGKNPAAFRKFYLAPDQGAGH